MPMYDFTIVSSLKLEKKCLLMVICLLHWGLWCISEYTHLLEILVAYKIHEWNCAFH